MREQPLDLRESLTTLRRRWITIAIVSVLGLCGGFIYAVLHIPQPRAVAQIWVPTPPASAADTTPAATQSQVAVATSGQVLRAAAASVTPQIPVDELQHLVSASAKTSNVLRIQVGAPTAARALQLTTEVADQYELYAKAHNMVGGPTPTLGVAVVTPPSTAILIAKYGLLGLITGLLLGAVAVLIRARRDRRLRHRDQIAGAIGVPVLASMDAMQYKGVGDWIRLLEGFDPSAVKAWTLRRVLRNLVPADLEGTATIHVISFVGDKAALATGPELALFAARSGLPTRLAPDENVAMEPLIAACAALRTSTRSDHLLSFGTENESWHGRMGRPIRWDDDPGLIEPHLVVSVVAVERPHPELTSIVGPAILAVSAGFATIDDLARVALAGTKAGLGIDGIIVVNPDPTDLTTGLLPDRTAGGWRAADNGGQTGLGSPAHSTGGTTWRV